MRSFFLFVGIFAWSASTFGRDAGLPARTNSPVITTNLLAFYVDVDDLGDAKIPSKILVDSNVAPEGLHLMARPVLSDAEFVAWNVTNYTFVITPKAALRLYNLCAHRRVQFVLIACGEPIYRGNFDTENSSSGSRDPVIYTDLIPFLVRKTSFDNLLSTMDTQERGSPSDSATENSVKLPQGFGGGTNVRYNPFTRENMQLMDQLLAATKNATNNVELRIDARIPLRNSFVPKDSIDKRDDKRIVTAVKRLFGKDKS
jgi:hypothetical protein